MAIREPIPVPRPQSMRDIPEGPEKDLYRGYKRAHWQLISARGRAAEYDCVGCNGPASGWSYNQSGIQEVTASLPGWPPVTYSTDIWQYEPRCRRCHSVFDYAFNPRGQRGHLPTAPWKPPQ